MLRGEACDLIFRVPLDCNGEVQIRTLYPFDNAIARTGRDPETAANLLHCLVMPGVHIHRPGAQNQCEATARFLYHGVCRFGGVGADDCVTVEMLKQGAALMEDVEQLHTAADCEHWDIGCNDLMEQEPFHLVPLGVGRLSAGIARRMVKRRVDIGAAGQQQSCNTIQRRRAALRLKQDGLESHRAQGIGIRLRLLRKPIGESDSPAPVITTHGLTFYRMRAGTIYSKDFHAHK